MGHGRNHQRQSGSAAFAVPPASRITMATVNNRMAMIPIYFGGGGGLSSGDAGAGDEVKGGIVNAGSSALQPLHRICHPPPSAL